jgi:hypothetical protein
MLYRELLRIYCYTVAMLPLKINPVLPPFIACFAPVIDPCFDQ